jgi:hypothetical protein
MAISSQQTSISSGSPSAVATTATDVDILIHASGTVWLGDDAVTSSTGYPLLANVDVRVRLNAGETLYAVAATGTQTVYVLFNVN